MKELILKLPKTTISSIISAILIYSLWKGYIWSDEANLIASILVALWLSVNLISWKFTK